MTEEYERLSLAELSNGEASSVLEFIGSPLVNNRLVSLGFTPGVKVDMIQNVGRSPVIVSVRGTRVALGRGEAEMIIVNQDPHG